MKNPFHVCRYDGEKWQKVSEVETTRPDFMLGEPIGPSRPRGKQIVFSNTCLKCGDIAFRRVKEIG